MAFLQWPAHYHFEKELSKCQQCFAISDLHWTELRLSARWCWEAAHSPDSALPNHSLWMIVEIWINNSRKFDWINVKAIHKRRLLWWVGRGVSKMALTGATRGGRLVQTCEKLDKVVYRWSLTIKMKGAWYPSVGGLFYSEFEWVIHDLVMKVFQVHPKP